MLGEIVSRAHGVTLGMSELALDRFVIPALFVQQRRRHAAKTVADHLVFGVAYTTQRGEVSGGASLSALSAQCSHLRGLVSYRGSNA